MERAVKLNMSLHKENDDRALDIPEARWKYTRQRRRSWTDYHVLIPCPDQYSALSSLGCPYIEMIDSKAEKSVWEVQIILLDSLKWLKCQQSRFTYIWSLYPETSWDIGPLEMSKSGNNIAPLWMLRRCLNIGRSSMLQLTLGIELGLVSDMEENIESCQMSRLEDDILIASMSGLTDNINTTQRAFCNCLNENI